MKIHGYIICMPVNTWGDKNKSPWLPREHSFGKTATEAWILFMNIQPNNDQWDRLQTYWINRGYCPKEATIEVKL